MKNIAEIEKKLREVLLPVFGLESMDEISLDDSLVSDLGADSLDFVEIVYLIECNFDVVIKTDEIIIGGNISANNLFADGKLTEEGLSVLQKEYADKSKNFKMGMSKIDVFSLLTVRDLVGAIHSKLKMKECSFQNNERRNQI